MILLFPISYVAEIPRHYRFCKSMMLCDISDPIDFD